MKKINLTLTIILSLLLTKSFAQNTDTWVAFWNKEKTLIGYKNKEGKVEIKPKFGAFTSATRFDYIIGAVKEKKRRIDKYYLTKKGTIVGNGNLYIFDNGPDCESEGFIRFRDSITHRVGMFNRTGKIVIPANYDDLMPVRNGMIMALKGGHWDASQQSEHNPFPWLGGKQILIDTNNNVLVNDFPLEENIDFYSVIISELVSKNPIRQNFKAVNGKYYSFINFDKEFKAWLRDSLLKNLSVVHLLKTSYSNITFFNKSKGWLKESKAQFMNKNFDLLKSKLLELNKNNCTYEIFTEGLNPYQYKSKEFEKYFNNCEVSKNWIYPLKTIVITHQVNKDIIQDQISFLKTPDGYKLIEVSINTGEIR